MGYSNRDVVESWAKQARGYRASQNLQHMQRWLISYSTLIGFCTHSGDAVVDSTRYSVTTGKHQTYAMLAARKYRRNVAYISVPLCDEIAPQHRDIIEVVEGGPRESLIRNGRDYWLTGVSWGDREEQAWAAKLPGEASTITEALRLLAPPGVTKYKRQGDVYFVPTDKQTKDLLKGPWSDPDVMEKCLETKVTHVWDDTEYKQSYVPKDLAGVCPFIARRVHNDIMSILDSPSTWSHVPLEVRCDREGNTYARGSVRHTQHKVLNLGKVWHRVEKSRAVVSMSRSNQGWAGRGGYD